MWLLQGVITPVSLTAGGISVLFSKVVFCPTVPVTMLSKTLFRSS